jgi:hypothetical protein
MTEQQRELRNAIRSKIHPGMSADDAADAIAEMFFYVEDIWVEHDATTYGDPSARIQTERWLAARVHRETMVVAKPWPNRVVEVES